MKTVNLGLVLLVSMGTLGAVVACGGEDLKCGTGTRQDGDRCVAISEGDGGANGGGGDSGNEGGSGGEMDNGTPPTFDGIQAVAPASDASLFVAWHAAEDDATAPNAMIYNVYVATDEGEQDFSEPTLTTPPGKLFAELNDLEEGTTYYIVVRAENSAGIEDENTEEQSGVPQVDEEPPTFAGVVEAESVGPISVKLTWEAGEDDLTPLEGMVYVAYWGTGPGLENLNLPAGVSDPGATEMTVEGLPLPDTTYYFVVRGRDAAGNTDDNQEEMTGKTAPDDQNPAFGGCILAQTLSAGSVDVVWQPAQDDVTTPNDMVYLVYASKKAGEQDFSKDADGMFVGGSHGTVKGLDNNTKYYFVCRAQDSGGNIDANTFERSATTDDDSEPPTFDGALSVTNVTTTSAEITWNPGEDNSTLPEDMVYVVYDGTAPGGENFTDHAAVSDPGATSIVLNGLNSRTSYYWVVRAMDEGGNESDNDDEVSAKTKISFSVDVQPIFNNNCAYGGCHANPTTAPDPSNLLILSEGQAYDMLVNHTAFEQPTGALTPYQRVVPFDAVSSYLYLKITNDPLIHDTSAGDTEPMPYGAYPMATDSIDAIQDWIGDGALDN